MPRFPAGGAWLSGVVNDAASDLLSDRRFAVELRGLGQSLGQLDLRLAVPKNSHALLLRSGVLFCSTESTCEFVLTPPESANVK